MFILNQRFIIINKWIYNAISKEVKKIYKDRSIDQYIFRYNLVLCDRKSHYLFIQLEKLFDDLYNTKLKEKMCSVKYLKILLTF